MSRILIIFVILGMSPKISAKSSAVYTLHTCRLFRLFDLYSFVRMNEIPKANEHVCHTLRACVSVRARTSLID